jgi:hypothetical protein
MTFEGLDAATALERGLLGVADLARRGQFPHLDGLVQAAADKLAGVRGECDTIHTILVAVRTLEALEQVAHLDIPHPDALVKRAGSDELGIGRNGDRRDAILYGERQVAVARFQVPDSDGSIATSGSDRASIAGEV